MYTEQRLYKVHVFTSNLTIDYNRATFTFIYASQGCTVRIREFPLYTIIMLRLSLQEAELQEQSQAAESLQLKLQRYEEELGERAGNETPPPPTTPPGLSLEEGAELQATIEQLEGEVSGVRAELAAKEEAERRLGEGEEG